MPEVYSDPGFRVPIKCWLPVEEIEQGAMAQLRNAAEHPEAIEHIAVMPDCHQGYGIPVGSIFVTEGSVIPNAVGVDIGCGVGAYPTGVTLDESMDKSYWRSWGGRVMRDVPTGFSQHKQRQFMGPLDTGLRAKELQPLLREKAAVQLGTLGGGNHFLEVTADEEDKLWFLTHSGSRHTGLRIANHYHKLAVALKPVRGLQTVDSLASLAVDDQTGQDYLHDMAWAADFASANRARMLEAMVRAFGLEFDEDRAIDVPHNYAWIEGEGRDVRVVHRKGATSAKKGEIGVIPGSMGTASYIVRGLGNKESFESCSHGAGRQMSRKAAKERISEEVFASSLAGTYSRASMAYVDEAPAAYKDIDLVIERQADLIEVVTRLRPVITIKGDSRAKED